MIKPMVRWDVYLRDEMVDSIWFCASYTAEDVVDSLVHHDGYPPSISVQRGA